MSKIPDYEMVTIGIDGMTFAIVFNGEIYWMEFVDGMDVNTDFSQADLKKWFEMGKRKQEK